MSKKPSFQFYPGDWRKDQNLSRASLEAKGAMIEIMCLAFECEKRGVLKTGKTPWSVDEIAHAIGGDKNKNIHAIEELLKLKVIKKDKKNAIFSARMVKDDKISKLRRVAGFKGGNPKLLNQTSNQKPTPSSSSSTSSSINTDTKPQPLGMEVVKKIANETWKDQAWRETVCQTLGIEERELKKWMGQFNLSVSNDPLTDFSASRYKKIFRGFVNREREKGITVMTDAAEQAVLPKRLQTINS